MLSGQAVRAPSWKSAQFADPGTKPDLQYCNSRSDAGGELELQPLGFAVGGWHLEFNRKISPRLPCRRQVRCVRELSLRSLAQKICHHNPRDVRNSLVFTLPLKVIVASRQHHQLLHVREINART